MVMEAQKGIDTVLWPGGSSQTDNITTTVNLDTKGAGHATIRITFSAEEGTDASDVTTSILESNDTVVSNFATITAAVSTDLTAAEEVRYEIDLHGRKRYLRLLISTANATDNNISYAAIATLTNSGLEPAATTDMITGTGETVVIV